MNKITLTTPTPKLPQEREIPSCQQQKDRVTSLKATANSAHPNALSGLMCKAIIIGSDVKMPKLHDVIVKRQNDFDVIVQSS